MSGKMIRFALALAVLAVVSAAGAAEAVTLYTPALRVSPDNTDVLSCNAFNASNRSITVTARLFEEATGTLKDKGTLTLAAGRGGSLAYTATSTFGGVCRFTYTGIANEIRGSAQIMDYGGSTTRVVVEAR